MIPRHAAALAEALGTGMLVTAVVGSGIMAERLAGGNVALALLANTIATGAILLSLIFTLAPLSGAHLNPAVTFCMAVRGLFEWRRVPAYIAAQFAGGNCRNVPSARDVCSACFLGGTPSARGLATTDQRICGDVWTALSDLGMLTGTSPKLRSRWRWRAT
jgi:hypothetical protein